jgi:peptidoglycan/xylan/chitin deacetylase (PgdA/CDA1 family)
MSSTLALYPLNFGFGSAVKDSGENGQKLTTGNGLEPGTKSANKIAILNFDDGWKNHYQYVKPILDRYNIKATFYIVCNYVDGDNNNPEGKRMNWNQILDLQKDGMEIGSHTMNHINLEGLPNKEIDYEIGQSKQCLKSHGINASTFAYPFSSGTDNEYIINTIAKYYDLGRSGGDTLMFLHCDGWKDKSPQKDCRTTDEDGKINYVTRYSLLRWAHQNDRGATDDDILNNFIQFVNSQTAYNPIKADTPGGTENILAVPIIVYHNIDPSSSEGKLTTNVGLFEREMRYLHDNGFKTVTMADIGYNQSSNYLYIKK